MRKLTVIVFVLLLTACAAQDADLTLLPPQMVEKAKLVTFKNYGPQTARLRSPYPIVGVHEVKAGQTLVVKWDGKEYLTSIGAVQP